MPISTGSYFSLSRFRITPEAEDRETLYSGEQPPKKMPTFIFFIVMTILFFDSMFLTI